MAAGGSNTWAILFALLGFVGAVIIFGGMYYLHRKKRHANKHGIHKVEHGNRRGGSDTSTESPDLEYTTSDEENSQTLLSGPSESSLTSDGDATLEASVGGSIGQAQPSNQSGLHEAVFDRERLIIVHAPPGRLGIVIDSTSEGPPAIHAVKDSSPLVGRVHVGDRIIAVDDVNVISLNSIQVTKIITDKSREPTRKLSILRVERY